MFSRLPDDKSLRRIYAGLIVAAISANAGLIWTIFAAE
jgi:hypothetical protein